MKKTLLIITALLFITSTVFPQSKININDLVEIDGKMYKPLSDKLYSGIVYDSYENTGTKKLDGFYRNGLKHVKWTWWNEDGGIDSTGSFKKGLKNGQWKYYYSNGNLKGKGQYRVGNDSSPGITDIPRHGRHGKWTFWHENGQKLDELTFKDGKASGLSTSWYENGIKEWEYYFIEDGTRDSVKLTTRWYDSGQKWYEGYVKTLNDTTIVWNGLNTKWYENGLKMMQGIYKDGNLDGLNTEWYENGQKKFEGTYTNGLKNGHGTMTYADSAKYVGEWKEGSKNGQGTYTWANGSSLEATWFEGVPDGNAKWIQADDDYYVGEIKGSKTDGGGWNFVLDGQGTMTRAGEWEGQKYTGEWKDGSRYGLGTLTYRSGAKYAGEWKDGNRHGQGIMTYTGGRTDSGVWADDKFLESRSVSSVEAYLDDLIK
ncbi:MAG: hypothetical protein HN514_09790 [Candidatus Marinimicrobia bacterium]|nr:hypothetical protein [Candidatus Neomarinimicrobiota bacterium]